MAKYPEPPPVGELAARCGPEDVLLPSDTLIFRVYFRGGSHPTNWSDFRHYGPTAGRFDHHVNPPRLQNRGIFYAAEDVLICLAEVFQDGNARNIDRDHKSPWLVGLRLTRSVSLLDLCGAWPTRAGASQAINSGQRPRARRWSQRIYEDYPEIEGLYHPSSLDAGKRCVTLYERAQDALPGTPVFHRALADPAILPIVHLTAHRYRYTVHP
jgi:hypothetical protein